MIKRFVNGALESVKEFLHALMYIIAFVCILGDPTYGAELLGSDVGVYVGASRVGNDLDTIEIGVTLAWKHVEFDLSHGAQKTQWRVPAEPEWQMDEWQSGTTGTIRVYPFNTAKIRPMLIWSHVSDIFRGKPFNDKEEPTSDFYGAGVTIGIKKFELDVAYGSFGRECHFTTCSPGSRTNELKMALRGYF